MDNEKRNLRNLKRRQAYASMNQSDKQSLLSRRRMQYASRKLETGSSSVQSYAGSSSDIPTSEVSMISDVHMLSNIGALCSKAYVNHNFYPSNALRSQLRAEYLGNRGSGIAGDFVDSVLPAAPKCPHCFAFRFFHEPPCFCCSDGEIRIVTPAMPDTLSNLFTGSDAEAVAFQKYSRTYNNNLAFTTFSARKDKELLKNNLGVYTFKVQGKIHHFLNPLESGTEESSGIQLYFYDPGLEIEERLKVSERFSRNTMFKLIEVLAKNPYVAFLRQLKDLEVLDKYRFYIVNDPKLDQRIYNEPTCNDVSGIICIDDETTFNPKCHIQIYSQNTTPYKICHNYGCYDPLQYPLIFPGGQIGWHYGIEKLPPNLSKHKQYCRMPLPLLDASVTSAEHLLYQEEQAVDKAIRKHNIVSCRQYYCYKMQIRADDKSMLLHTGRLFQQYIVDMFVKIETSRLEYFYKQQKELRTESLQGLIDSIASGNTNTSDVGKKTILPPSFIGGPRDMRKRYMDAMALVQQFGKPDFFLTMTCNPSWSEISDHLLPNELPQNRPDLLSRVFKSKLELLKKDLLQDKVLGKPAASVYSIEFQKRGLPHTHLLLIMARESKLLNCEAYDRFISAELPDPEIHPNLHKLVLKHMIHGPCGSSNPKSPCMQNKKCKNRYPRQFQECTIHGTDSYPQYRRRNNGLSAVVRRCVIDNRHVVPYNPYLLEKYDCPINVEICSTIKLVKYIYKYIYKGPDKIAFQMSLLASENEIEEYQRGRWVAPPEAAWRIFSFDLFEMHPAVIVLQLHLPNNHYVSFPINKDLNSVVSNTFLSQTMLTQFFHMNKTNQTAISLQLLYRDFPKYFVWDSGKRIWTERKKGTVIGRIVSASPMEGERYYLRLLLNHVIAPTSYNDLLRFNNYLYPTFRESALARNLLSTDSDLDKCLEEAVLYQMPRQLRHLFASILAFCSPSNPSLLWEKYKYMLSEDYNKENGNNEILQLEGKRKALQDISMFLDNMGRNILDFQLGTDANFLLRQKGLAKEILSERNINVSPNDILCVEQLNDEQRYAYEIILSKVQAEEPTSFFIDGPGGTGKTYLYKTIMATLRSQGHIVLATATSGVAACMLPGGRTAHSRFSLLLNSDEEKVANVTKQSATAELIREAKVIIWDEAPMAHREAIEAFAMMLRDITGVDLPFGNKTVIFGGDFRQVLPVVTRGTKEQQINASIFHSPLWPYLTKIRLTHNMRSVNDAEFARYLLRIGNGTEPEDDDRNIILPHRITIPFVDEDKSLQQLIDFVYPDMRDFDIDYDIVMNRVLLGATNSCVNDINHAILNKVQGDMKIYTAIDVTLNPQHQGDYEDFLHSLNPSSLPPYELMLKINSPVVLLRNLSPTEGLCNGTRMLCKELNTHTIVVEIGTGPYKGHTTILHKIPLQPTNHEKFGIAFKRYQFPIRLCYAMTINKAQGQTLDRVGIYLREPVFSHGQLYVALSRVRTFNALRILIAPPTFADEIRPNKTQNIVYREIIQRAQNY